MELDNSRLTRSLLSFWTPGNLVLVCLPAQIQNRMTPRYYAMRVPQSKSLSIWKIENGIAWRPGAVIKSQSALTELQLAPDIELKTQFETAFPHYKGLNINELKLKPGQYHPRIARSSAQHPEDFGGFPKYGLNKDSRLATTAQLVNLIGRLKTISRTVEPKGRNLESYGHDIRECLIIACTELETLWINVLRDNKALPGRPSTNDYIKLLPAMRLDEYEIEFIGFPSIGAYRPFANWSDQNPTQSLAFYDAYNAVKHDRETNFPRGKLECAFHAVGACMIVALAQFGYGEFWHGEPDFKAFVRLVNRPKWLDSEVYSHNYESDSYEAIPYTFP